MQNNKFLNLAFRSMILNNKYADYDFDSEYAFDEKANDVLFKIYMLLLKSEQIDDKSFNEKFNKILEEDFKKLNEGQKQYIINNIIDPNEEKKKNNLQRERK